MDKRWLYVVDFQHDFVLSRGALPVPGAENIIHNVNTVLERATPNDYVGVIFSLDTHDPKLYPTSAECLGDSDKGIPGFPPHCYLGTPGWMLSCDHTLVDMSLMKYEVRKNVFDVWADSDATVGYFHTGIDIDRSHGMLWSKFSESVKKDSNTVDIIGVASDYCVKYAVEGFLNNGYDVRIINPCTAGILQSIEEVDFHVPVGRSLEFNNSLAATTKYGL